MKKNLKILVLSAFVILTFLAPPKIWGMEDPYGIVEKVYDRNTTYSPGLFNHYNDGSTFLTLAKCSQKAWSQCSLAYDKERYENYTQENILGIVSPGQDGRERISKTTKWPNSIHTQLTMIFKDAIVGYGSGSMVGPHHLLTCGHNVYNRKRGWAEEISAYPALNGEVVPFGCVKVTKAYTFQSWQDQGDERFDMALLLLDQPIGDYTGWGGLLSATEADLSQEKVNITGYPGDNGFPWNNVDKNCTQMWSICHKIKTVKSEQFDYEHDTFGGQSGSAIWINKWGVPMILGVHTLGSNSINSGVRLSERKFTDFLVKVISETYTLNKGSLPILPDLKPKKQPLDLQGFLARELMIDECINQYEVLGKANLSFSELNDACQKINPLYKERQKINKARSIDDIRCENVINNKMFIENTTWMGRWRQVVAEGWRTLDALEIREIIRLREEIKKDVLESMEMYEGLFGQPHPRWNELAKV